MRSWDFRKGNALPRRTHAYPADETAKPDELGNGMLAIMKARLMVMGNRQKGIVNKAKTYSPVAHPVSYKVILVLHMGDDSVEFVVFDVEQAYLSTQQVREVYVGHPPGYKFVSGRKGTYYVKLKPGERQPFTAAQLFLALYGGIECGRLY